MEEQDYKNFKCLLEYFVAHLEHMDSNENESSRGFEKYIKPFKEKNNFFKSGPNDDRLQDQIESWNNFPGFKLHLRINGGNNSAHPYRNFNSNFLNYKWDNIIAEWDNNSGKIENITITNYTDGGLKNSKEEETLTNLGLFDENEPNDALKKFFDDFCEMLKKDYGEATMSNKDSLIKEVVELLKNTHNVILHGAPGTGKTYLAKQIAKEMNAETAFVQFHPSYDYTDFVEGLRPKKNDGDGEIGFERKDGVFKEFCKRALENLTKQNEETKPVPIDHDFENAWNKLLEIVGEKFDKGEILKIGNVEYTGFKDGVDKHKSLGFKDGSITYTNVLSVYKGNMARPSGAHQKDMEDVAKYMKQNCGLKDYKSISPQPFVFIIGEINRGELSKIFGELFYTIEPDYRVKYEDLKKHQSGKEEITTIRTQYANLENDGNEFDKALNIKNSADFGHFFVPENVYIIGTMNDIDRNVEQMDFAFRRRFAFYEIKAGENLEMLNELGDLKDEAKRRMENLNNAIWHEETQAGKKIGAGIKESSSYHIGGAYFLKLNDFGGSSEEKFNQLWKYHLEGLLREYLRDMENAEGELEKLKAAYDLKNAEPKNPAANSTDSESSSE